MIIKLKSNTSLTKKQKILKISLISFLVLILIVGGLLYWFIKNGAAGLFKDSGIPKILGLNRQVQINETENPEPDINTITEKLGYDIEKYERKDLKKRTNLNLQLDSKEAAYLITKMQKDENTVKNVQVKINQSDNLQLSAVVNVEKMADAFGANLKDIEKSVGRLPEEIPLYTEINLDASKNFSSLLDIKIGKVSIPKLIYAPVDDYIDDGVEDFFNNILGIKLKNIGITDGKLNIEGSFPSP